jgi:hypothetical protein
MIRQEAILQSPLRFLDRTIHGGLGRGHLGVIMAPAGVGKSACLAQIGLDALLRGKSVLHVALGQSVEHVSARYDALFDELAGRVDLADRPGVFDSIGHRRLIWSSKHVTFDGPELDAALGAFRSNLERDPSTILVDGFGWDGPGAASTLAAVKASAARVGAELWMTARDGHGPESLGSPRFEPGPDGCAALVDIEIFLEPSGRQARVTLVKDFDRFPAMRVPLVVEGGLLRQGPEDWTGAEGAPGSFTLLASGSAGAEEEFGACAERWGVHEVNYTFGGRQGQARTRGLVELTEDELQVGDVSPAYVKAHLHRALAESADLRRVLQTIWHQVITAGEVFSVGTLNPDQTAHGGTGWAVELARHWRKPVHLFDQERNGWLRWIEPAWVPEAPPTIGHERFAGAGTRTLSVSGRAAIEALFERSFGTPRP